MTTATLRPVRVFERRNIPGTKDWETVEKCRGWLHQFGTDYEEFESGGATYSIAIVELADGTIIMPRADRVQFVI